MNRRSSFLIPTPSVAVIMPVRNRAGVVGRAIDSVLAQEFGEFELIVVDDGSTDDTAAVVEAIADPRLMCLRLPVNRGANAARNRGIEAATAPLLAFLDSDDLFLPHKLGFVAAAFRDRPALGLLIDSFVKSYRPARDRPDVECRNEVLDNNDEIVEALFTRRIWKATSGITVRRDLAIVAGLFDEQLPRGQDFDFILRVAKVGRCATTDQTLWFKTNSPDSISADLGSFVRFTLAFYQRYPEYYDNPVYRRGLAQDLGRHFVRLLRRGKIAAAWRDAVPLARVFGARRLLGLVIDGSRQFGARRKRLRATAGDQEAGSASPV